MLRVSRQVSLARYDVVLHFRAALPSRPLRQHTAVHLAYLPTTILVYPNSGRYASTQRVGSFLNSIQTLHLLAYPFQGFLRPFSRTLSSRGVGIHGYPPRPVHYHVHHPVHRFHKASTSSSRRAVPYVPIHKNHFPSISTAHEYRKAVPPPPHPRESAYNPPSSTHQALDVAYLLVRAFIVQLTTKQLPADVPLAASHIQGPKL